MFWPILGLHEKCPLFMGKARCGLQTSYGHIAHCPLTETSSFQKCPDLEDDTHFSKVFFFFFKLVSAKTSLH